MTENNDYYLDKKRTKKLDRQMQQIIDRIGVDRKTQDEVFDTSTLLTLEKLMSNRFIDYIDFPISTGKEGNVFLAYDPEGTPLAVKIYRISTSTFKHITQYLLGDPRFKSIHKSRRDIIYAWTSKEYKNLELLHQIKVAAPRPIKKLNNVLIMEYIGTKKQPAPLLKDATINKPDQLFQTIISSMKKMFQQAHLIHSDLSAFNILIHGQKPYLIDLGQGVLLDHPQAQHFLKRDISNILSYFRKFKIKEDKETLYNQITQQKGDT